MASACALPRVRFGFVRQAFERSVVGFVVSLGLFRPGLIRLLLVFVATSHAAHALSVSADRRQADSECKKHNCRCAAFHVRTPVTRAPRQQDRVQLGQSIDQIVDRICPPGSAEPCDHIAATTAQFEVSPLGKRPRNFSQNLRRTIGAIEPANFCPPRPKSNFQNACAAARRSNKQQSNSK
jgi:hypothetical protein